MSSPMIAERASKPDSRSAAGSRKLRPGLIEPLEARIAPAALVAHWIGGSGHWSDPAHWDLGVVPNNGGGNTYTVVIDLPGSAPAVTLDAAISINGLTNSEVLHLTAGASTLSGSLVNTGLIDLTGSASLNLTGTFTAPTFGSLAANGGTVKISGTLDLAGGNMNIAGTSACC